VHRPAPPVDEVVAAIRKVNDALGHVPSYREFKATSGFSEWQIRKHFDSWIDALTRAGLSPEKTCFKLPDGDLLSDWGRVARELSCLPTRQQYDLRGDHGSATFRRFGPWVHVPQKFWEYAKDKAEWADVLKLVPKPASRPALVSRNTPLSHAAQTPTARKRNAPLADRPMYGNPLDFRGLRHEPVNEQGVVFLFGMVAKELGYMVEAIQTGFPDCEAKRQVAPGKWQRIRVEFEFESRNFDHPPEGCDVIVCWRHNWPECPSGIEVIDLSKAITELVHKAD
jgi:hypothetical protein